MKKFIKKSLRFFGADIVRFRRPQNLSNVDDITPVSAAYLSTSSPVLLNVPLKKCLTFRLTGFVPTCGGVSPFIRTLMYYHSSCSQSYKGSPLEAFYNCYQPRTAGELFGIEPKSSSVLNKLPPSGAPLPWRPQQPSELVRQRKNQICQDNNEHGAHLSADDGDPFLGPVSSHKGQLEFSRLIRVFESIKKSGFSIDWQGINNINVVGLTSGNKWRAMVSSSGQHRLAALAVLGYETVVVQLESREGLSGIIRREDYMHWPMVQSGVVTECEALATFDRLFSGRQPECANNWLDYLRQEKKNELKT